MTFRRRTYPEILDNMLTALIGGVAAEAHPYPPPERNPPRHYLRKSAPQALISVFGSRGGQSFQFRKDRDVKLLADGALQWEAEGMRPDPGTMVEVNYTVQSGPASLTDIHTGSVVRTMAETMALEMARLEAQLESVYKAGFIDTASGSSLDQVVALLGIKRVPTGRPMGDLTFTRAAGANGTITILAGTRIITPDGNISYETTQTATMAATQTAISIEARDLEANEGLPADSLTVLPVPILGIASVTNPAPTAIANRGETDPQLRERAKTILHGSERATLGALHRVLAEQGFEADIEEFTEKPGQIRIFPHADNLTGDQHQRLQQALKEAAPAGIEVLIGDPIQPKAVDLELVLTTDKNLAESLVQNVHRAVEDKISAFFEAVPTSEDASLNKLAATLLAIDGVDDARPAKAYFQGENTLLLDREAGVIKLANTPNKLGTLTLIDANLPSRLDIVVTVFNQAQPADPKQIRASVTTLLTDVTAATTPLPADATPEAQTANQTARSLDFTRLLRATPLPGMDPNTVTGADLAPDYAVEFVITQSTGLTHTVSDGGPAYVASDFERLALRDVETREGT